jgi:ABC-type Fe3+/spermidine/putrescine transport system ATPase subunit
MRPERIQISALSNFSSNSGSETPDRNTIKAKITNVTYLGNRTHYELETSFGSKITSESVRLLEGLGVNSKVSIQVKANEALFLPDQSGVTENNDQ